MSFRTRLFLLFALVSLVRNGRATTNCSACRSRYNLTHCQKTSSRVSCTVGLIVQSQSSLLPWNPSLKTSGRSMDFRCFQLNFTTPTGERHFEMGCTNNTRFCDGWTVRRNCTVFGLPKLSQTGGYQASPYQKPSRAERLLSALELWPLVLMASLYYLINRRSN
ncbi:uncharacterized protein LOC129729795 [Wyeomyia smithii]|uniref:uncharacterized protein LOC129729795 n=1 Tax=Wyeomyia smithii TaxID=174621 RepID=UPI002467F47E|nr:uncharacterized protein LOC129729795 [Wyeomyia smithii]